MQYLPELLTASSRYLMDSAEVKHILLSVIIAQRLNIITCYVKSFALCLRAEISISHCLSLVTY